MLSSKTTHAPRGSQSRISFTFHRHKLFRRHTLGPSQRTNQKWFRYLVMCDLRSYARAGGVWAGKLRLRYCTKSAQRGRMSSNKCLYLDPLQTCRVFNSPLQRRREENHCSFSSVPGFEKFFILFFPFFRAATLMTHSSPLLCTECLLRFPLPLFTFLIKSGLNVVRVTQFKIPISK